MSDYTCILKIFVKLSLLEEILYACFTFVSVVFVLTYKSFNQHIL